MPEGYTLPTEPVVADCVFGPPEGGLPPEGPNIPLSAYSFSEPQVVLTNTAPIGIEQWLPDNRTLMVSRGTGLSQTVSVALVGVTTGEIAETVEAKKYLREPRWLAEEHTIVWRELGDDSKTIPGYWVPGYQVRSLDPLGERRLSSNGNGASTSHSISPDGMEFVFMSLPDGTQPLIWNQVTKILRSLPVDFAQWRYRKGDPYPLHPFTPLWHPKGNQILFHDGTWMMLYDLVTNTGCEINVAQFTASNSYIDTASWSPNGRYLLIQNSDSPPPTITSGPLDLILILDTYTGEATQYALGRTINSFAWARDNQVIAIVAKTEQTIDGFETYGFYLFNIYSGDVQRIFPNYFAGSGIKWSDDGSYLAMKCRDSLPNLPSGTYIDNICISHKLSQ